MIAGTISIELAANVARIQADMERARRVVGDATSRMSQAAGLAKSAFGAIAGALSVAAFAGWIKGAIDAADAAGKLAAKTGVAVEDLAGLELAFELGGSSVDSIVGAMNKLSKAATEGSDEIKALGINVTDSSGALLGNKDLLYSTADAFAKMEDGAKKTALAVGIFGKSGAELIPMLNDGAEGMRKMDEMARKLGLTITQEAATAAAEFNDNMDLLGKGSTGVAQRIAGELLPTLSGLSGSMLEAMSSGDKLKNTASALGGVLKGLYTIGVVVSEIFGTIGKVLGGAAALIGNKVDGLMETAKRLRNLDFRGAASQMGATFRADATIIAGVGEDISSSWKSSFNNVSELWDGTSAKVFQETAKIEKARAERLAKTKEEQALAEAAGKKAAAAAESQARSRESFIAGIQKEVDSLGLSATAIKINEAAAMGLTGAKLEQVKAMLAVRDAYAEEQKRAEEMAKIQADYAASIAQEVAAANKEAEAKEEAARIYGMTRDAIDAETVSRLENRIAQLQGMEGADDEIKKLELLIDARKRAAAADSSIEAKQAAKQAADENLKNQIAMWDSIDKTAHDTFVSILDGGKGMAQRLKDTLKNTLFDWLYQMTIKKWIINLQPSVVGGMPGAAGPGGIGSMGGVLSAAKSAYAALTSGFNSLASASSGLGFAGSLAGGAAAGVFAGRAISGGYGIGGGSGNSAVNGGTALGAAIGTFLLPGLGSAIGGALGGVLGGTINRLFGMKAKEYVGASLVGNFGAGGAFSGTTNESWKQKGGLFRSDKSGTDKTALGMAEAKALSDGYTALRNASADFASALGINAASVQSRTQAMNIALTKDQAANEKAIAEFFTNVANTIAIELVPNISSLSKAGESASATLERIASNYAFVDVALKAMDKTFGAVGVGSITARERLVELVGGIEALGQGSAFFAENFLTEAERLAPIAADLKRSLADMGLSFVDTREEFAAVVKGLDPSKAGDAQKLAGLFKVQQAFAQIYPAAEKAASGLEDAKASFDDLMGRLRNFGDSARSLRDGLLVGSLSTLTAEQQYAETRRQYERTLAAAKGGDASAQSNFASMANAFLAASQKINGGDSLYSSDFASVLATSEELSKWTASEIDIARASLNTQEAQLVALQQLNANVGRGALVGTIDRELALGRAVDMTPVVSELKAMRAEVAALRSDQAEQTGNLIMSSDEIQRRSSAAIVEAVQPRFDAKRYEAVPE